MDGVQCVIQNANFKVQPTLKIDLVQFKRNLPCTAKNLTTVQKLRLKVNSQFLARFDSNKKQSEASLKCISLLIFHICFLYISRNFAPDKKISDLFLVVGQFLSISVFTSLKVNSLA